MQVGAYFYADESTYAQPAASTTGAQTGTVATSASAAKLQASRTKLAAVAVLQVVLEVVLAVVSEVTALQQDAEK